jgi:DNA-binding NtrC family response regulator
MNEVMSEAPHDETYGEVEEADFDRIVIAPEGKTMHAVQIEAVAITLHHTNGNRARAARLLGISRPTLAKYAKLAAQDGRA